MEAQDKLAMLGRLATASVHEIANPLEGVRNMLCLAQKQSTSDKIRAYLDAAREESDRITYITTQTLQFHRQSSQPVEVSVSELVESVLSLFRSRIKAARLEVHIEKRGTPFSVVWRSRCVRSLQI